MSASLFGTGGVVSVNVNGTLVPQSFTAAAGQTVFTVNNFVYTPGTNSLLVFINGQRQVVGRDFTETSTSSFTLVEPCIAGDYVDVIGFPQVNLTQFGSASSVNFTQLNSLTQTTVQNKLQEFLSVKDFGAVGDGVTNDNAAFLLAQAAGKFVEVPAGFNCIVNAGLNYYLFFGKGSVTEPGRTWDLCPYPQNNFTTKSYKNRTWGNYESAVGRSVTINSGVGQTKENTQVLGTNTQSLAQIYTDRDHVADFISAYSYVPDVLDNTSTYTATTVTNNSIVALNTSGKIKPGMIIDTQHATICTGVIQSISGNVITVDAWYPRSGGAGITPANGIGCIINPNNKIFGQNIVVSAMGNGTTTGAQRFSGVELDLSTPISASPIPGTWGYDMAVISGYIDIGYQIRGKRNFSFYSNPAGGAGLYGFRSDGDARALSIKDSTVQPIEVLAGAAQVFGVGTDGTTSIQGGSIKFIGPLQTTAAYVSIGSAWVNGHGALFYVTGYNIANGQEGKFLFAASNISIGQIYNADSSGCTVAFQVSGNTLQIKATTGTFQFTAFQLLI